MIDVVNDKYERQMKKGVLDMLVLRLLKYEAKYGYQIIQEMKEKSEETFLLKDGTFYPILYRLEDEALVISRWSEAKGKQVPRKYYEITQSGLKALDEIEALWKRISVGISKIMEDSAMEKSMSTRLRGKSGAPGKRKRKSKSSF